MRRASMLAVLLFACLASQGSYIQSPPVFLTFGGVNLISAIFVRATVQNSGSGDVDLYTAPAGSRAFVSNVSLFNGNGSTAAVFEEIKISGTYFRLTPNGSFGTGTSGTANAGIILEPGDSISLNTSVANINAWAWVVQYASTVPVYCPRLTAFVNGDATLYTVPAGKTAASLASGSLIPNLNMSYANGSGGARTISENAVNSGGSPGGTNQIVSSASVNDKTVRILAAVTLSAGDFLSINSDANTAGQFAWVCVVEK